jgi:hypothetical protein
MVAVCLHLRFCVFVKAACGKPAHAVWAADGGQRLTARLLRPDWRGAAGIAAGTPYPSFRRKRSGVRNPSSHFLFSERMDGNIWDESSNP